MDEAPHIPVLMAEVLQALDPQDDEVIVDGTFGAGGYSRAIMDAAQCSLIAFDRDPHVAGHVETTQKKYGERFTFKQARFGAMEAVLGEQAIDGIVLDIGVSSMQIDEAERGFSFRFDGTLDMRMSGEGISAADIVNNEDEKEIARILWEYGEERASRRIARAIVSAREEEPITTTGQLKNIIHKVMPVRHNQIDPATRSFQGLRIAVNHELDELRQALHAAETLLVEGGRLVVVTFHSLEDRIVKHFLKNACEGEKTTSRHLPSLDNHSQPAFTHLQRKAVTASDEEITRNPRARSAKLRAAVRTAAPAREASHA